MSVESEKLVADVKTLVHDAEEFIRATAAQTSDNAVELRRRMQQSMGEVKENVIKLEAAVIEKVKPAAVAADQYVRSHPWETVGVFALVGLVIGLLSSRR